MNSVINPSRRGERRRRAILAVVAFAALLPAACGKRGPLYLPDGASTQTRASEQAVNPAPPPAGNAPGEGARKK